WVGQSHMVFTRPIGWLASPLPLAGSRRAKLALRPTRAKGAADGGSLHAENPDAEAPHPDPPPQAGEGAKQKRNAPGLGVRRSDPKRRADLLPSRWLARKHNSLSRNSKTVDQGSR